jgi:hypothetical protein
MFLRHSVHINQSIESCRQQLREPPGSWLPGPVTPLSQEGHFEVPVGLGGPAPLISKKVELTVGQAVASGDWLTIPVSWRATGPSHLFPVLDGELRLEPVDPAVSRLMLSGTYRPPFGTLGREIDAAVLHSVAEATVKSFAEGVAARVSELATTRVSDLS